MSIMIKGVEMPTDKAVALIICSSGKVYYENFEVAGTAVPVPTHGRLKDADAIRADIEGKRPGRSYEDAWTLTVIDAAPTVIEADKDINVLCKEEDEI